MMTTFFKHSLHFTHKVQTYLASHQQVHNLSLKEHLGRRNVKHVDLLIAINCK